MKLKLFLLGFTCVLLFSLNGCKSKESAYQAAYEAAKEKEMEQPTNPATTVDEVTPVEKAKPVNTVPVVSQKEKVTPVDYNGIKRFSVVVGSFTNKTNATSLKEKMESLNYKAFLAQNERGMYRVIIATFDDKADAAKLRDQIKMQFHPDQFQDAWILEQQD